MLLEALSLVSLLLLAVVSLMFCWSLSLSSLLGSLSLVLGVVVVSLRGDTERRIGVAVDIGLLVDEIDDLVIRDVGGRLDICLIHFYSLN